MRSPFLRLGFIIAVFLSAAAGALLCRLPLLETLGYEYSLASALIISFLSGSLAAHLPHLFRKRAAILEPVGMRRLYAAAVGRGMVIAAVLLAVSLLNGFRVPFCNLESGLLFFGLMPGVAVFIASAVGLAAGLLSVSPTKSQFLFIAFYVASLASGFYTFYSTPAVFLYHPFAGFYPGVLYDRIIEPSIRLTTFRIGTFLDTAAIVASLFAIYRADTVSLSLRRFERRSGRAIAAFVLVIAAWMFQLFGGAMGHRASRSDLEAHLPRHITSAHLEFFFPKNANLEAASNMVKDAEFSLSQVTRYFNVAVKHRISVFVFADEADKGAVMGASNTNVAKPWRREVYVTLEAVPHPVLRHELVHAVSADFAPGPFKVAGQWMGLIPNPALIEGIASAASGQTGDLTLHQWAAAMSSLGLLPPLRKMMGLGFFDLAASAAYTASGSFCDWVKSRFGAKALVLAYLSGDFELATGKSVLSLEAEWTAFLKTVPFTDADRAAARVRFDKTPIIRTVCVHETARLCDRALRKIAERDFPAADRLLTFAHTLSRASTETFNLKFYAANEKGDYKTVRAMAKAMLDSKTTGEAMRSALLEMLLDLDMAEGSLHPYAEEYEALARAAETEDRRRTLEVKAHLARTGADRKMFDVLALRPGSRAVNTGAAALLIAKEAWTKPEDPIRAYLLARQYFNAEDYDEALAGLSKAKTLGLMDAPQTVRTAAGMMKGRALLSLDRYDDAAAEFKAVAADPDLREGLRETASDWADRAVFMKRTAK